LAANPEYWPYVSLRLDVRWYPNVPSCSSPVITVGRDKPGPVRKKHPYEHRDPRPEVEHTPYYRLTAAVFAWLTLAGDQLERRWLAGEVGRDQVDAYCEAMGPIWAFAGCHIPDAERRAAKPELPGGDWGPR